MTATLLNAKQRRLNPRAQIQTLVRIARRATCHAEWMATMLGQPEGDRQDPSFGFYDRLDANTGDEHWIEDRKRAEADRAKSLAKAVAAAEEIQRIAAEHGIRP